MADAISTNFAFCTSVDEPGTHPLGITIVIGATVGKMTAVSVDSDSGGSVAAGSATWVGSAVDADAGVDAVVATGVTSPDDSALVSDVGAAAAS